MLSLTKSCLLLSTLAAVSSAATVQPRDANTCSPPDTKNAYIVKEAYGGEVPSDAEGWFPDFLAGDDSTWSSMRLRPISDTPTGSSISQFHITNLGAKTGPTFQVESEGATGNCVASSGGMNSAACSPENASNFWYINCASCSATESKGCQFLATDFSQCATNNNAASKDPGLVDMEACQATSVYAGQLFTIRTQA